jgi:hypothetical protein
MKKMILPLVAVVLAGSLSAFTLKSSSSDNLFYWFDQTNHEYVGSTSSSTVNPLGCMAIGSDCVKGYQEPSQPLTEPARQPDAQYAQN